MSERKVLEEEEEEKEEVEEGARPEACAASSRAVWRVRLVAFRVFRRACAPKRARHPTEQSGECV